MEKLQRSHNEHLAIMKIAKHQINWHSCKIYPFTNGVSFILFNFNVCLLSNFMLMFGILWWKQCDDSKTNKSTFKVCTPHMVGLGSKHFKTIMCTWYSIHGCQTKPSQIQTIALKWITTNNLRRSTRCYRQLVNELTIWFNATAQTKRQIGRSQIQFWGAGFDFQSVHWPKPPLLAKFDGFLPIFQTFTHLRLLQIRTDNF